MKPHRAQRRGDGVYSYRTCWVVRMDGCWLVSAPGATSLEVSEMVYPAHKSLRTAKRHIDNMLAENKQEKTT